MKCLFILITLGVFVVSPLKARPDTATSIISGGTSTGVEDLSGLTLQNNSSTSAFVFSKTITIGYDDRTITFNFDKNPVTITVSPDMKMDENAKLLLNMVATLVGSPKPFPDFP